MIAPLPHHPTRDVTDDVLARGNIRRRNCVYSWNIGQLAQLATQNLRWSACPWTLSRCRAQLLEARATPMPV